MFEWEFFIYTVIYGTICGRFSIWANHWYNGYRDKRFLKHLRITHPIGSHITLSSVSTSDAEALAKIKEQLDKLPNKGVK